MASTTTRKPTTRQFGNVRKLPSGTYQASYRGPDGKRHPAPSTFRTKGLANDWLQVEKERVTRPDWCPPKQAHTLELARLEAEALAAAEHPFREVASRYLVARTHGPKPLKPRTLEHYEKLLDQLLYPTFATTPVKAIDVAAVEDWYYTQVAEGRPTYTAHAYSLLSTIMKEAVRKGYVAQNPCMITGASNVKAVHEIVPATEAELATIVAAVPFKYRAMVLIAAWCGLRFGEVAELRRGDLDMKAGVIRVRRGVVLVKGKHVVGDPKNAAGKRDVFMPDHVAEAVRQHLAAYVNGKDGLLFPANDGTSHLRQSSLAKVFDRAKAKAGRPDLRWHDLRHTGATMLGQEGATTRELQAIIGHSTHNAAMRYQHATTDRAQELAKRLSARVAQ